MEFKSFEEASQAERIAVIHAFDNLTERVRRYVWDDSKDMYLDLEYGLIKFSYSLAMSALATIRGCESPIEQLLILAIEYKYGLRDCFYNITPQKTFKTPSGTYRVDFFIEFASDDPDNPSPPRALIVECDGHDFHEKTKHQAAKDKKRDRALQSLGHHILRFTGSELYKDPDACVAEIRQFIHNALN